MQFDHEKLHVYQAALEFNRAISEIAGDGREINRHVRDQLNRAALSIPLNIAEGNGKRSHADRKRYFEIARGSAMECAAAVDVLIAIGACQNEKTTVAKTLLHRIVSMLTKMTEKSEFSVREEEIEYQTSVE